MIGGAGQAATRVQPIAGPEGAEQTGPVLRTVRPSRLSFGHPAVDLHLPGDGLPVAFQYRLGALLRGYARCGASPPRDRAEEVLDPEGNPHGPEEADNPHALPQPEHCKREGRRGNYRGSDHHRQARLRGLIGSWSASVNPRRMSRPAASPSAGSPPSIRVSGVSGQHRRQQTLRCQSASDESSNGGSPLARRRLR